GNGHPGRAPRGYGRGLRREGRDGPVTGQDGARGDAFAGLHPAAELDRDPGCHGLRVRGRLAPGCPWTDWAWSLDRVLGDLERMAGAGGVIYLWSAGSASGAAGSIEPVAGTAAPYLSGDDVAVVEEAVVEM